MMQSQSFHLTVPRAQSCNFEAIHEFSTQSITILQIPVPIAPSPSDSDTILQIVEDSHHVGALQSAFIQSCDRFCKPSRIKKSINNCKICSQSWDACHNQLSPLLYLLSLSSCPKTSCDLCGINCVAGAVLDGIILPQVDLIFGAKYACFGPKFQV